ncbi:MAG TPA: AraC family transcriptional regulator [Pyrinomonadaceae bacterium]|nr:AraC family transcriptional regulator [Pyrinomonadaceae bacterium]
MGEAKQSRTNQPRLKPGEFFGDVLHKYEEGGLVLCEFTHQRPRKIPKHSHELAFFNLILDGTYHEHFTRRSAALKPFTTIFHPSGIEHHDEIGPRGMRIFSVEMRESWLDRVREYGGLANSALDLRGGELTWLATRLYREYRERACCSPLAIEGLILEMLATVSRFRQATDKKPPAWLPRVIELLNSSFQQNLTVNSIAAEVGVHPVYLSRIFRRFQRETLGDHLHKLRIQFAVRQLTKEEMDLAGIAVAAGFSDQSHFTRVFKDLTGMTPGAFRAKSGWRSKASERSPRNLR